MEFPHCRLKKAFPTAFHYSSVTAMLCASPCWAAISKDFVRCSVVLTYNLNCSFCSTVISAARFCLTENT